MSRCDCELLMHDADCPYDGPDYTAARFDALKAEVTALREAGNALATYVGLIVPSIDNPVYQVDAVTFIDRWRALVPKEDGE